MTTPATSFSLKHEAEFDHALDEWTERALAATKTAIERAGAEVATESAAQFGQAGGPANVSGHLGGSITTSPPQKVKGMNGYEATVGPTGVVYARKVEIGKRGQHSARAHPYFKPGWLKAGHKFMDIFKAAWREAQHS